MRGGGRGGFFNEMDDGHFDRMGPGPRGRGRGDQAGFAPRRGGRGGFYNDFEDNYRGGERMVRGGARRM